MTDIDYFSEVKGYYLIIVTSFKFYKRILLSFNDDSVISNIILSNSSPIIELPTDFNVWQVDIPNNIELVFLF
jgi:hypothetical protein